MCGRYGILVLVICLSLLALSCKPVNGNPYAALTNPGTSGIPQDYGSKFLIDENVADLRFSYEYVNIKIGNVAETPPELNATYIISNSGEFWINQTIAIPGFPNSANTSIEVDNISQPWWLEYVSIEGSTRFSKGCYLFNMTFAPNQTRTINMECFYEHLPPYYNYYSFDVKPGNLTVEYIVMTGNSWVGGIGEANIVVEFDNNYLNEITNYSFDKPIYQYTDSTTIIKYHNISWNPVIDLFVSWTPKNWPFDTSISMLSNSTVMPNENVTIQLNNSLDSTSGVKYLCDWGDGTIANWSYNTTLTHNYTESGEYTIQVWSMNYYYKVKSDQPVILTITVEDTAAKLCPNCIYIYPIIGVIILVVAFAGYTLLKRKKPKTPLTPTSTESPQ